ncbi:MAG TPA: DMT family transporter [Xanthobacteraceae bacterium]|nr:DMT family transporter [Xanthobacteraceae bacterium]
MNNRAGENDAALSGAVGEATVAKLRGRTEDVPRGILMMVVATILFSGASAASKWLVGIYPVGEVLFLRSLSSLVTAAAAMLPVTGLMVFATRRPGAHLARGLSQSISQAALLLAFSLMPLAGAVAINFSAPLFAAVVSIIWLKEPAGLVRGGALVIGFLGVLIVTNPGANSLTLGALFALVNAVMYGTVTVAVRGMTRTESANTLVIWQLTVLACFHSFLLVFGWRWPTPVDAAMLFGTGFTNAIGQWFWTKALHLAPAPAVTPFYYLMLVWALLIGFAVWGDVPSISLLVGSAIVVATGLFLFLREARLQRALSAASPRREAR